MKNKELIKNLIDCENKDISKVIVDYLQLTRDVNIKGIQQSLDDIVMIKRIIGNNKYNSYTEIGSSEGGSLWIFANLFLKENSIVNIIEPNVRESLLITIEELKKNFTVNLYSDLSIDIPSKIKETDITFIDGNHEYHAVKQDFELYNPITSKAIILHDTSSFPGCIRLKNELSSRFKIIQLEGSKCLHTMTDQYDEIYKERAKRGLHDFFYKELIPGTTFLWK